MSKVEKNFNKVVKKSTEGGQEASSIAFTEKKSIVNGLGPNPINPFVALMYSSMNGKSNLIGHIGEKYLKEIDKDNPIILAVDNKDLSNPTLYLSNNSVIKLDTYTFLEPDTQICLYWEYGPYSLLIFSGVDPVSKETVIDCSFCNKKEELKVNRYLFLSLLPDQPKNLIIDEFTKFTSSNLSNKKDV